MMAFNLADYEDVATLNKWFISNFPSGRSDISVISHDAVNGYILIQATLWRDSKDTSPAVSNVAFGARESYIQNMKKFYVEDTATSALGRAIILLKGSDKTATKDDMKKVNDEPIKNIYGKSGNSQIIEMALRKSFADDARAGGDQEKPQSVEPTTWSVGDVAAALSSKPKQQECSHGVMILKEGTAKTGKPYYGYVCSAPKGEQCNAKWAVTAANGSWFFREEE
jgi:hypothetical protein